MEATVTSFGVAAARLCLKVCNFFWMCSTCGDGLLLFLYRKAAHHQDETRKNNLRDRLNSDFVLNLMIFQYN